MIIIDYWGYQSDGIYNVANINISIRNNFYASTPLDCGEKSVLLCCIMLLHSSVFYLHISGQLIDF